MPRAWDAAGGVNSPSSGAPGQTLAPLCTPRTVDEAHLARVDKERRGTRHGCQQQRRKHGSALSALHGQGRGAPRRPGPYVTREKRAMSHMSARADAPAPSSRPVPASHELAHRIAPRTLGPLRACLPPIYLFRVYLYMLVTPWCMLSALVCGKRSDTSPAQSIRRRQGGPQARAQEGAWPHSPLVALTRIRTRSSGRSSGACCRR